jgi:hypothetical protein
MGAFRIGVTVDSHPVTLEQRPTHWYVCAHCSRSFRCTTAQYAHEDHHELPAPGYVAHTGQAVYLTETH